MGLFRPDLRPVDQLEVEARQLNWMAKGMLMVGMMLFGLGGMAWLTSGTLGLLLGIMGIFFGLMLMVGGLALRFAAKQKEFELDALEAQTEREGDTPVQATPTSYPPR